MLLLAKPKMKINKSAGFVRAFKRYIRKLNKRQVNEVCCRLNLFDKNWQAKELETHKLKNTQDKWAFTILHDTSHNDRVVFIFIKKGEEIWLLNIGSHDVVYRDL